MMSVMPFDPDPSLYVMARRLAFFMMSFNPVSPTIIVTWDPDSLPCSWKPFPCSLPMTRNIFRRGRWRIVSRLRWRISCLRWMGKEMKDH
jgi:hypothetical protein